MTPEPVPAPAKDQGSTDQLSAIGRFIDKYYLKQRPWIQSWTFIVFVLLFAYGFINSVSGMRVIKGNLWVEKPQATCAQALRACSTYAQFYDIRWGTQEFVSNSRGEYYVAVGFMDYVRMLATGKHTITFLKDGQVVANETLKLNRLDGEFNDVTLPSGPGNTAPVNASEAFSFLPAVWAGMPQGTYRLLVEGIRLAGRGVKADAGFELMVAGTTVQMKDLAHQEMVASPLPLVSDTNVDLGSSFYFPVPGVTSLPIKATVKVTIPGGIRQFYSDQEERFQLPNQQLLGQPMQLNGSNGSILFVRIVYDNEVKLFRESDIAKDSDRLEPALLNQGLLVRWSHSPLGKAQSRETNALWTGNEVPFDVVQRLLRVAISEKIPLKKIQYKYSFASTNNLKEIQFGSSPACIGPDQPLVPESILQKAVNAATEVDFMNAIAPVSDCKATVQSKKSKRVAR